MIIIIIVKVKKKSRVVYMKILMALFMIFVIQVAGAMANTVSEFKAGNYVDLISNVSNYAVVTGVVSNSKVNNKEIYLNFGKNFNTSFSVIIDKDTLADFSASGINDPVSFYKNKNLAIEGVISLCNGKPQVVIKHPSQIKVIN